MPEGEITRSVKNRRVIYSQGRPLLRSPIQVDYQGDAESTTGEWMHIGSRPVFRVFLTVLVFLGIPFCLRAQQASASGIVSAEPPDAPRPQIALNSQQREQAATDQAQSPQQPNPASPANGSGQGSSSSQTPGQTTDGKSQQPTAADQLKAQEHQRVMGVMATFNTTSNKDALPLSSKQKFQLFFKSATDPWPFLLAGVVGGIGQANNDEPEWGQGTQGYAKRFGAAYSDYFIGNFLGNAVLTSMLHEDPRYFQKGTGKFSTRFLWAAASTVWCKRDNGTWGPNYANIGGNLLGTAIARAYYPATERTVADTLNDGFTVTYEGIVGAEVIEFWPDIVRHHKRKKAEKLARQAAQGTAMGTTQLAPKVVPPAGSENPKP